MKRTLLVGALLLTAAACLGAQEQKESNEPGIGNWVAISPSDCIMQ